ncbi:hypothetical protein [Nocardiopsis composta]|uniref:Uncharacterized protein n=1 Tax=Nocardiopsis composta TaxID=157465 RepID=A0A7W8QT41_9ACTN|nr:hypothetical protein [Nocardiopsis composta]MBB5436039.1 hypothetical protein [Nocardiopsis composta]
MARNSRSPRRLAVDGRDHLWAVRHEHRDGADRGCREVLAVRRDGDPGRLLIVFEGGPGRLLPDGYLHSGAVGTAGGALFNLHRPGTVRALVDEAVRRGWRGGPRTERLDGWTMLDALAGREEGPEPAP